MHFNRVCLTGDNRSCGRHLSHTNGGKYVLNLLKRMIQLEYTVIFVWEIVLRDHRPLDKPI